MLCFFGGGCFFTFVVLFSENHCVFDFYSTDGFRFYSVAYCTSDNNRLTRLFSFRVNTGFPHSPERGFPQPSTVNSSSKGRSNAWVILKIPRLYSKTMNWSLFFPHFSVTLLPFQVAFMFFMIVHQILFKHVAGSVKKNVQMHFTKCHFNLICIYLSKIYKVLQFLHCQKLKKWTQHESIDIFLQCG